MITVRLEREFVAHRVGSEEPLEWNILDEAREKGMVAEWNIAQAAAAASATAAPFAGQENGNAEAGPSSAGANGNGPLSGHILSNPFVDDDESAEAIAARLEAKYGNEKPKKVKVRTRARHDCQVQLLIMQVKKNTDVYDVNDEFIDDSELQQDAPTHYARTAKEGFFVHRGRVEVVME
jgi:hypothetical protein